MRSVIDRLRALPWWMRSSLAALAGGAATLGFAPTGWWPMLILAIACLTLLALPAPSRWQAAITGFCFGLAWYLTGITWLSVIFVEDMVALAVLEACYLAVLGLLLRLAGRSRAWPLLAAGSWMLVEYAISNFPFGGFPWLRLGYTTIDSPLAGLLPLVGVPGAGFALALVAQLLAWVVLTTGGRRRLLGALAALAVLLSGLFGALVPAGAEQGSVKVGYVQGNAPGGGIYGLGAPRTITYNHLAETQRLAAKVDAGELPKPDFVVWPENGTDLDPFRDVQTGAAVGAAVAAVGVPILVGTITEDPVAYERQTAAIMWYPDTGPGARYDKRNLVPFGEWVPLRSILEPLFPVVRYVGAQSIPGVGPGVLPVNGVEELQAVETGHAQVGHHGGRPPNRDGRKRDYLRGFGMQFWGCGAGMGASFAKSLPGFGADFKKGVKQRYPALVAVHPYGEVLPQRYNRVTVEGTAKDKYGIPVARIEYKIGENERKMIPEMYDAAESILKAAKAEILPFERGWLDKLGSAIHEHGTVRMGTDPKRAALNGYCQFHEVKNLFCVDGAAFPTATEKNPTLTILANTWRSTDYLAAEMKAGRL